jgi:hypothetical protein
MSFKYEFHSIQKSADDIDFVLSKQEIFFCFEGNLFRISVFLQDGLGGNAKTLMFVNISPADYNCDETVSSLQYAARVKTITNVATKQASLQWWCLFAVVVPKP